SNTTGSFNDANGRDALRSNTSGDANTASGGEALFSNTTGDFNTASGGGALLNNTTGSGNTASGALANVSTGGLFNATASAKEQLSMPAIRSAWETVLSWSSKGRWRLLLLPTRPRRKTSSRLMAKKYWEKFAALNYQAGTSLAMILTSFVTMVP